MEPTETLLDRAVTIINTTDEMISETGEMTKKQPAAPADGADIAAAGLPQIY